MLRTGLIQEDNVTIGEDFDCGHYVVLRTGVKLGKGVKIWSHTIIDPDCVIGDGTRIHCGCYIGQGTVIGKGVFIAPHVTILNDKYPPRFDKNVWETVTIEDGAVIGGGVTIGPGVTIGKNALIGAGALVLRNVPSDQLWVGHPAKRLR